MRNRRVSGTEHAPRRVGPGGEDSRQRAEFADQSVGGGGGAERPEKLDQDGSVPKRLSRRWWLKVPKASTNNIG